MSHFLFAVFGSAGDIFPTIAVAEKLIARQHRVTVLAPRTVALYVRAAGLSTVTIGDGSESDVVSDEDIFTLRFDGFASWRRTCTQYLDPLLREHLQRTCAVVDRLAPDLVVVHPLAPYGSLVAEQLGIRWVSLHLYPQLVPHSGRRSSMFGGRAAATIRAIERERDLARSRSPLLDRGWSPIANVSVHDAAFLAETHLAHSYVGETFGFPYWDRIPASELDQRRADEACEAPGPLIVASLGSFMGLVHRTFWDQLVAVSRDLGSRALLIGVPAEDRARHEATPGVVCTGFVPMSTVAAKATLLVHHGGIGTTYAGLLAGVPSIVVPYAFDQGFNARLVQEAGIGRAHRERDELASSIREVQGGSYGNAASSLRSKLTDPSAAATRIADRLVTAASRSSWKVETPGA